MPYGNPRFQSGGPATPAPLSSGVGPPVSTRLLRRHRNSRSPLLVLGGTPGERRAVASAFHGVSPLRLGAFIAVDCTVEEASLCEAVRHWLTASVRNGSANPLWSAERGTLYLESISRLTPGAQELLLAFAHRCSALLADESRWSGRLAAGCDEDPWDLVAEGRFSAALADGLDKIRVELDLRRQGGAA